MAINWHNFTAEETLGKLETNRNGLSEAEAAQRLERYGPNELEEKGRTSRLVLFLRQFASPLIYILLIAVVIEFVIGNPIDASVILIIVNINAVVGYFQESRAEKAMLALRLMTAPQAKVKRQGEVKVVPARQVAPGDIIVLETGDKVPADVRVIEATNLKVDESALTGESQPVEKSNQPLPGEVILAERNNMVHMGTVVTYGKAAAAVVATGMSTEVGKIAGALQEIEPEKTPLQENVARLSRYIGILVMGACVALLSIGVLRNFGVLDMFILAVATAVAVMPEGLPVVLTLVLALSMRNMARHNALIRKLVAVETLGAATIICSDKTGTLTKNEMTLRRIYLDGKLIEVTGEGYQPQGEFYAEGRRLEPGSDAALSMLLRIGALCNDSELRNGDGGYQILGDPTEGALLVAATKAGISRRGLEQQSPRLGEIPFQSERKYMATLHPDGRNGCVAYVKGSVEQVLALSRYVFKGGQAVPLTEEGRQAIQQANTALAADAMRVLALAYAELPHQCEGLCDNDLDGRLVFVGLVGLIDPPRPEAIKAVANCHQAGIKVVMITGDHKLTAEAVARQLGLSPGETISGAELEKMDDEELAQRVEHISVFARVDPLHKLRIVNTLKKRGHVVAMTGDGVNDAPALKAADIGIAMGQRGTDVAKEAAVMVLADDNFASIEVAVEEGRVLYGNLRRAVFNILSGNSAELFILAIAIALGLPLPLVAVQLLWINVVTETLCGIPLGLEPKHGDVLHQPPRHPSAGILYKGSVLRMAFVATFMVAGTLLIFRWQLPQSGEMEARTMAFATLVAFRWFGALNARSDRQSLFSLGIWGNRYLVAAIALSALLQIAVIYVPFLQVGFHTVPLGLVDWGWILLFSLPLFAVEEIRKRLAPDLFNAGKFGPTKTS